MHRFRMWSLVVPLLAVLACHDATAPSVTNPQICATAQVPRALVTPSTTPQLGTGYYHACALKTDATVICWGYNSHGQTTVPAGLSSVVQLSVGHFSTCALKADGTVVCWGDDSSGQVTVPAGLGSVVQLSAGGFHTCALKSDESVVCWGLNGPSWNYGQAIVPTGLGAVAQVIASVMHTCVLKSDATVFCWGGGGSEYAVPSGLASVRQVSGEFKHTCALKTDGTVVCWGFRPSYGETTVPDGLGSVAQVSAGFLHTCALKADGTVACWGYNGYGETTVPPGLDSVAQVSAGGFFTCARKTAGSVVCWGQLTAPEGLNVGSEMSDQSITFDPLSHRVLGDPPFALSASASSGLPVNFTAGGACSVLGITVTITSVGTCTVTANQAGNELFNPAPSVQQSFAVVYNAVVGHRFLQPINVPPQAQGVFKAGSTIPVKFQLFLADGVTSVATAVATIRVNRVSDGATVAVLSNGPSAGTTFRYDAVAQQYVFNVDTKNWTAGSYQITALLDDGSQITVIVRVR